jgi:flagellar biogenesis protein FliO
MRWLSIFILVPSCFFASEGEGDLPSFSAQITTMVAALVGVIAIGVLLIFVLKKIMLSKVMGGGKGNSPIRMLDKRALGAKSALYLIEVREKSFLIAESAQKISLIAELNDVKEVLPPSIEESVLDRLVKR